MKRRNVLVGGAAAAVAAIVSTDAVNAVAGDREFECAMLSRVAYPHDWREWPEHVQKASQGAVDRLLAQHPSAKVVSDVGECMAPGHPRYPDQAGLSEWNRNAFYLVRTVTLDRFVIA